MYVKRMRAMNHRYRYILRSVFYALMMNWMERAPPLHSPQPECCYRPAAPVLDAVGPPRVIDDDSGRDSPPPLCGSSSPSDGPPPLVASSDSDDCHYDLCADHDSSSEEDDDNDNVIDIIDNVTSQIIEFIQNH